MKGNEMNDTKEYTDGTVVTGTPPFPAMSPKQQDKHDALSCLNDIESLLGGKNGPSIRLRSFIEAEAVQDEPHRSFFNEIVEGKPYEISNDIGALRREVVSLRALLNYEYKKQPTRKEAVQVEPELDRLRASNAELLEALRQMISGIDGPANCISVDVLLTAHAAIAKETSQALYAAPQEAESVGASKPVAIEKQA